MLTRSSCSFASINFNDTILVNVLEYVWCVHQDTDGSGRRNNKEYIQLQAIDDHSHILPIFTCLK